MLTYYCDMHIHYWVLDLSNSIQGLLLLSAKGFFFLFFFLYIYFFYKPQTLVLFISSIIYFFCLSYIIDVNLKKYSLYFKVQIPLSENWTEGNWWCTLFSFLFYISKILFLFHFICLFFFFVNLSYSPNMYICFFHSFSVDTSFISNYSESKFLGRSLNCWS